MRVGRAGNPLGAQNLPQRVQGDRGALFEETLELDFSFGVKGLSRFRANIFNQRGAVGAVFRAIPYEIKAFEDLGYYSVDNLPLDLLPAFADLVGQSAEIRRAALVVDVREGQRLDKFPVLLNKLRKVLPTQVFFLEASDAVLLRRFSETRRPHPLGRTETVVKAIDSERRLLYRSTTGVT